MSKRTEVKICKQNKGFNKTSRERVDKGGLTNKVCKHYFNLQDSVRV